MKKSILAIAVLSMSTSAWATCTPPTYPGYVPNPDGLDCFRQEMENENYEQSQILSKEYSTGIAQSSALVFANDTHTDGLNIGVGAATYNGESAGALMFSSRTEKVSWRVGVAFSGTNDAPQLGTGVTFSIK